jgi:thiamine-monophosphate kinase
MNEPEFVDYLKRTFPFTGGTGIGDDTSVQRIGDKYQLITKDILIENVHFRLKDITLEELAIKSMAVNISDIAAMGGIPRYFYLGLGYPRRLAGEDAIKFFEGLREGCRRWHVELAGGDFSASDSMFISITMVGEATDPVYRHNAQNGDRIGITGVTGESAVGLKLLLEGEKDGYFQDRHRIVSPEVEKGRCLAPYVNAMLDVSDGVLIDLNRILTASGKGAHLVYENFPVPKKLENICRLKGWNPHESVLGGGEDYVLLFTISDQKLKKLGAAHPDLEYYIIGEITGDTGNLIVECGGSPLDVAHSGYDHFSR